ncbi:MAG: hypothetical protein HYW24_04475 [Candidatus Aenigmarchaeota archaeon]|nr:hypothetical protein [Candidatus Aenigmarchaeota archaeon]
MDGSDIRAPVATEPPHEKNWLKISLIVLFVVILVAVAYGGYLYGFTNGKDTISEYKDLFLLDPFTSDFSIAHSFVGIGEQLTDDVLTVGAGGKQVSIHLTDKTIIYECTGKWEIIPGDNNTCTSTKPSPDSVINKKISITSVRKGINSDYNAVVVYIESDVE